jgi:hypothetical protein
MVMVYYSGGGGKQPVKPSYFLPRTFAATFRVLKVETRILSWETILLLNNHNAPQGSCTMLKAMVMLVTSKTLLQLVGLGD